ncbi:hypothetical protein K458DRAFT_351997 [Lentithecium fluviatile CBS 122367]|uniref:G domain-containing protein n=1 Tax=Lentithecium fluviatile CBS 122367 TaxID=1168545 RepID=A0A6G1IDL8_9PLEO|nr:hypothetical protein K458DRAFT_351997 [Lentithecium fluviatile CBS 122367]
MASSHASAARRNRHEDHDREYYEHECRKFRICIIGKAGVGKTTLLSKVFGINEDEAGVVRREDAVRQGGGRHNIYDAIVDENRNSALVIHDSCGFETGEGNNLSLVKSFIEYRSEKPTLQEQLHCIWYCISLVDPRQLHEAERQLFSFLREKDIPLVFVLTKYDAFVGEKVREAVEDMELATPDDWRNARSAAQENIADLRGYLESTMGYGVKVQEVSKTARDERLVQKLVVETTAIVKPNLRIVWFRAQGVLAQQKRVACVEYFPRKVLHSLIVSSALPLNPFRGAKLSDFFESTFHHCLTVWNLPGQTVLFTQDYVQNMFHEASQSYITFTTAVAAITPFGFLDAPRFIKLGIQIACDLIMMFQQLFWATPRRQKLSFGDLRRELDLYKDSGIRESIHRMVEGAVNYGNSFSVKKCVGVIRVVVNDGCKILHSEAVKSHKRGVVAAYEEPPFAELPAQET